MKAGMVKPAQPGRLVGALTLGHRAWVRFDHSSVKPLTVLSQSASWRGDGHAFHNILDLFNRVLE